MLPTVKLGEVQHSEREAAGKPLDGVRVLAAEQMQALPFATQLLAHLGADVVKIEHPVHGESGRGSRPQITDRDGRRVGATYLRNNLSKRSLGLVCDGWGIGFGIRSLRLALVAVDGVVS